MLCVTNTMADQVEEYSVNNIGLSKNTFSLNGVKDEESQENNFADDKVDISETAITKDNAESQDHLLHDKMKQHNIGITWANIKTELSFPEVQHDNLKTEEDFIKNDMKIEFNNGIMYCEDCHVYYKEYCTHCGMLVHVLNRNAPINDGHRSREELPGDDMLDIQDYFGEFRIFASKIIPEGVKFGPFIGLNRTGPLWKIKGGKFVVNKDKSKYLNWMQYINPARNISEQNLLVFQYKHDIYYQSNREIQVGDELLVYFGEEYEDSLNGNVEMDFTPNAEHIDKDVFACTFCCLGFNSKLYLVKHKIICPRNVAGRFSIEELVQCPSCKIYLDRMEYTIYHMVNCCERNSRMCILPTPRDRTAQVDRRKTRPLLFYRCPQCRYRTKYKGDLKNHTNLHCEVKMYKCGTCSKRFKTKEVLKLHVENISRAGGKEHSTGDNTKSHIQAEHSSSQDEMEPFKCSLCAFRTKYKKYLKIHLRCIHLKEFQYKCDRCDYIANFKSNLKRHVKARHTKELKYKRESQLKEHIKSKHSSEFKYKCDTCGYKANWKSQLKRHIEGKHLKEFKYKCDSCEYKANLEFNLKRHVDAKHSKVLKYKCDRCDYKTTYKQVLMSHIQVRHLKELKYNCDMCDYKANLKGHLKRHIATKHLKEFQYKCDTCDYKAKFKANLKSHIETRHVREFKYQCDGCDYKAMQKRQLKAHIDTRHLKEFKFQCDTCDYKTNWQCVLKRHIGARHLKKT